MSILIEREHIPIKRVDIYEISKKNSFAQNLKQRLANR